MYARYYCKYSKDIYTIIFTDKVIIGYTLGQEVSMADQEWSIADRLRRAREDRGWSQVELSKRSGVHAMLLSRIETKAKKDVNAATLRKLAKALRVSGDYLLGLKDELESMIKPTGLATVSTAI
jgi:DNA-binding Xre family transcriptional regulator